MNCPNCPTGHLFAIMDAINPNLHEWVCPTCSYYCSNSEAFHKYPELFSDLGRTVLANLGKELDKIGLTPQVAQVWAEHENTFAKRNFTALDTKQQLYRTVSQQRLKEPLLACE